MKGRRSKPRPAEHTLANAKRLRRESTVPERKLWSILRNGRLGGLKFRRQHAIGPYIVDFYCPAAKLVVELDGLTHVGRAEKDAQRTAYLEAMGLTVLRITNDDMLEHEEAAAEYIARTAGLDW